jgi:dihydrofolate reductase
MATVEVDISMSVDGFVTGPDLENHPGLGRNGKRLHAWIGHEEGQRLLATVFGASGAVITSRRVYDDTSGWEAENGFFRMPVYVVTHRPREPVVKGETSFTFVGGVRAAIEAASATAGDRAVHIMGGASIVRQALRTGLVDVVRLHVAPVLLGSGTRLFDAEAGPRMEWLETVDTPEATHLSYRCA